MRLEDKVEDKVALFVSNLFLRLLGLRARKELPIEMQKKNIERRAKRDAKKAAASKAAPATAVGFAALWYSSTTEETEEGGDDFDGFDM